MSTTDSTSFFVAKAGDWAAEAIDTLQAPGTILAAAIYSYNAIFLALGGSLFLYLAVRAIIDTAHTGKVGGKNSEIWFPARFVVAVSLIVPLPPTGFNFGEYTVFGALRAGVAGASSVWEAAVDTAAQMQPLVEPIPPEVKRVAGQLFMIEFCRAMQNATAATSNSATITEVHTSSRQYDLFSYDGDHRSGGINGQCGEIRFDISEKPSSASLLAAHKTAGFGLQQALAPIAQVLVAQFLPPYDGAGSAALDVDVIAAQRQYDATIMAVARDQVVAQNEKLGAFRSAASSGGWVKAGAWALNLMTANETVQNAVGNLPTIAPPREEWWAGNVYVSQRAALKAAEKWWNENWGVKTASTDQNAYGATRDISSAGRIETFFDPARFKAIYDNFLLGFSGQSDANALGRHERNPIAELTSLGHSLVTISWAIIMGFAALQSAAAAIQQTSAEAAMAASSIPILGAAIGGVDAPIGGAAAGLLALLQAFGPMVWLLVLGLFGGGVTLAYVVPMTPALMWFFGVARYFMSGVMTVAAANLWAISHLELEGEGMGQRSTPGWMALLGLIARPAVMTIGLILGLAVLILLGKLFGVIYFEMVSNSLVGHNGGITGLVIYTVIGAGLIEGLVVVTMWGVGAGADYVMSLIGERLIASGEVQRDTQGSTQGADSTARGVKEGALMMRREDRRPNDKQGDAAADQEEHLARDTHSNNEILPG